MKLQSLKIHILYDDGEAPSKFSDAIEQVFQLAKQKKGGDESNGWSEDIRGAIKDVRKCMSDYIEY